MGYPPGPVGWPLLGSAVTFLGSPYATLMAIGSYGKLTSVQLGWNLNVFINDIGTAHKVMHHRGIGLERPPIANPPLLIHFLALNGPSWKERRGHFSSKLAAKLSNSEYSFKIIQDAITLNVAPDLDKLAASNALWYPSRHCSFIDMNLMFNALYGVNLSLNADPTGYVEKLLPVPEIWFKSITNVLVLAACSPFRVGSWIFNKFTNHHNDLEATAAGVVVQFMKESGFEFDEKNKSLSLRSDVEHDSFIEYLINETEMNSDEIMADIALALIAGTNTTSKALEYGLLLMAKCPDIQQRIYEEVASQSDLRRDVGKSNVLRAFIQETLRLSVVSPLGMPHYATERVVVDGVVIPKGAVVHNNMYYMHRSEGVGGETVNVDQWLDRDGKFKNDRSKMMMFGYGGRSCPGQGIAIKLMQYVFALVVLSYELSVESTREIKQQFATVPVVEPQIGIRVRKRNSDITSMEQ